METPPRKPSWRNKFRNAFRGIAIGIKGDRTNSFRVHIPMAILVLAAGLVLGVSKVEMIVLVLCIGIVISAELFNSSVEKLARSVTKEPDEDVRDALDIASAAVLVVSLMAVIVGAVVLISSAV